MIKEKLGQMHLLIIGNTKFGYDGGEKQWVITLYKQIEIRHKNFPQYIGKPKIRYDG